MAKILGSNCKIIYILLVIVFIGCNKKKVTITGTAYDINTGLPLSNFNVTAGTIVSQKQHEFPTYETTTDGNGKYTFNKIKYGTEWPSVGFGTKNENYFCVTKQREFSKHSKKITQDVYYACVSTLNLTLDINTSISYGDGDLFIDAINNNPNYNFRQYNNFNSPNYTFYFTNKIATGNTFSNLITVILYNSSQTKIKEQSITLTNLPCGAITNYTIYIN